MIGTTLSHYKIIAEIGRGGMGVVYKAEDTKLKRTVAVKLLPLSTLGNEDDRARFFREAQAAAQLQHANIATVYAIEEASAEGQADQPFIAMELIEGETLTERIATGPMKLTDVVDIATQVALALEAAHEKNIVHRDVKSGNVMINKKGTAKVLDFGLAKTAQSTKLTQLGSTLGTIAYMSPEQARGEEVDRRSDIWSLGVLIYEMICGRLPFASEYEQAAVYSILNEEPEPLTSLRTGVPMGLEWIVSKLLAKDADHRYQNVSDLLVDLKTVDLKASGMSRISTPSIAVPIDQPAQVQVPAKSGLLKYVIGSALGAGLVLLAWMFTSTDSQPTSGAPTLRLSRSLETARIPSVLDISNDGTKVAYIFDDGVYVLDLTTGESFQLDGTGGSTAVEFSPDGERLLLTKTSSIARIPVSGGTAISVIETTEGGPRANWGPDDWIVFEDRQNVFKYSESKNELVQISHTELVEEEDDIDWPSVLPGGEIIIGTVEYADSAPPQIRFWDFESGEILNTVNFPGYRVQYLQTGHLVGVVRGEGLVIMPFDIDRLEITGPRIPIVANVADNLVGVSHNGTMVYVEGADFVQNMVRSIPAILQFPRFLQRLDIEPGYYATVEISPDESKLLLLKMDNISGGRGSVSIYDIDTRRTHPITSINRISVAAATWMPGGDSIAYTRPSQLGGPHSIYVKATDGTGDEQRVYSGRSLFGEIDVSPDGSSFVYVAFAGAGLSLLHRYNRTTREEREVLAGLDVGSAFEHPRYSPDGRWIAYTQNDGVIVQNADGSGTPINFSRGFAQYPRWTSDGRYFMQTSVGGAVFRYEIAAENSFIVGRFVEPAILGDVIPYFDVFGDGQSAIVADIVDESDSPDSTNLSATMLNVVVNWFEEIKE